MQGYISTNFSKKIHWNFSETSLDSQVEVISKTLNEELSKEWLTRLWKNILNKFNEYLISDNFSPSRLQAQAVGSMVEVSFGGKTK